MLTTCLFIPGPDLSPAVPSTTQGNLMLNSVIGRLRVVGFMEGASFLLLLGFAMPLKYLWGQALAVRIIGMIHGALFLIYLIALAHAAIARHWNKARIAAMFIASVLPFGTFVADKSLRREQTSNLG
jgi:integral membrane protein